jgi:hypothetical protein
MSVTLVGDEDGKLPKSKAWIMYRITVKIYLFYSMKMMIYFLAYTNYW